MTCTTQFCHSQTAHKGTRRQSTQAHVVSCSQLLEGASVARQSLRGRPPQPKLCNCEYAVCCRPGWTSTAPTPLTHKSTDRPKNAHGKGMEQYTYVTECSLRHPAGGYGCLAERAHVAAPPAVHRLGPSREVLFDSVDGSMLDGGGSPGTTEGSSPNPRGGIFAHAGGRIPEMPVKAIMRLRAAAAFVALNRF